MISDTDVQQNLYGYVPSKAAGFIFVIIFIITTRMSPISSRWWHANSTLCSPPRLPGGPIASLVAHSNRLCCGNGGGRRLGSTVKVCL